MARTKELYALWLSAFAAVGTCQYNPVSDNCQRWDHQSVVKNNMLYIDGGSETFTQTVKKGQQVIGTNTYLIEVDLSQSWDWKTNISETVITKQANPNTGTSPPSYLRGAVYRGMPSDDNLYIYGGTQSQLNGSFSTNYPDVPTYSLWSYNTSSNSWNQYDVTSAAPERPSGGAYAEAPDQGLAFYLNGQVDKGSSLDTTGLGNQTLGLEGMIMLNLTDLTKSRNLTTSFYPDAGIVSSVLTYVPQLGDHGVLVGMGGTQKSSINADVSNGTLITFDNVNVFDISTVYNRVQTGGWYSQNTTGKIPEARIDSCAVAVAAPDNSSYNIYLYGGRDPTIGVIYDDIYILSMPSFTWTQMYSGKSPRFGHTCHLVGNRQLLTVGGASNSNVTSGCDWETKGVGIMDLSTKVWGSVFNAHAAPYQVTADTVTVIGGSPMGNATVKAPAAGFSDPKLQQLFFPPQKAATATATGTAFAGGSTTPGSGSSSTPATKKVSGGAIAGGIIAGLAILALIAAVAFFFIRRRRQQRHKLEVSAAHSENDNYTEPIHELAGKHDYSEMATQNHYSELAGSNKPEYELAGQTQSYELGTGKEHSRGTSQKTSAELAREGGG